MAARGEVVADGEGVYRLAGRLAERAARLETARAAVTGDYDGRWTVVIVTAAGDTAKVRQRRRGALRAARLGELRDGVWMRPANLDVVLGEALAPATLRLESAPADDVALAAECFDLEGWARRARLLRAALADTPHDGAEALAQGFVRSAEVLRHLQRDPLLPVALLADDWPGPALRADYDRFDAAYRRALAVAHRAAAATGN
jgi:phenylacetic acid degradation operon negative regulatory protein